VASIAVNAQQPVDKARLSRARCARDADYGGPSGARVRRLQNGYRLVSMLLHEADRSGERPDFAGEESIDELHGASPVAAQSHHWLDRISHAMTSPVVR
jgi:hypothetical protein